jgi:hypothetical protein
MRPLKKIKHLAMQKSEKCGRISANPQPGNEGGLVRQAVVASLGQALLPSLSNLFEVVIQGLALIA